MAKYSQKWHNRTSRSRSTETSDGLADIQAQLNNLGREIKKVNEKSMLLKLDANNAKDPITPKIAHSKKKGKPLKKLTTRNLVDLFKEGDIEQQLWDSIKGTTNPSYQERRQSMEDTLSKFMSESEKRHEENSNLIKEIQASTDTAIRNLRASIKLWRFKSANEARNYRKEDLENLPSSTEANSRDQVKSISTTI
ncbi:hypothetical protein Tco_0016234 [Tanacetum coccineum]